MTRPARLGVPLGKARAALRMTVRDFLTPDARMADELACVVSVMLAIALAWRLGAGMVGWAAFTAFILMKGDVAETVLRGVLRLIGTAIGAGLALVVLPLAARSLPVAMVAAAAIGAMGLYGMLTQKRAYAWFISGITFEMILLDALTHPAFDTWQVARTRLIEVAAGTAACVFVSITARAIARREWRKPSARPVPVRWHPQAARHAAQAGIALAVLPAIARYWNVEVLPQVAVTIMAVMIVPVAGLPSGGLVPVSRRLLHRAMGCMAGGLLSLAFVLLARGDPAIILLGTAIGIMIGRHIENGPTQRAYIGLQFTLAVLVTLLPDNLSEAEITPALMRLAGILFGMAMLEPILLAWHWLVPSPVPPAAAVSHPGNKPPVEGRPDHGE
ncbi:FUSC family protein [Novosphingobium sp. ZN18A2]|uniref:FUSC family protein n=1 Tax=Novosphingobium sp. ZN18A2 TaxID=3079861 RepID=UPI0030D376D7